MAPAQLKAQLWAGVAQMPRRAAHFARSARSRASGRSVLLYAAVPALSGVNALVGLILPALLGPARFGQYSLAVTLFQYGLIFDLGISQLIDRRVPVLVSGEPGPLARFVNEALWTRLYIAVAVMAAGTLALLGLGSRGALPFAASAGILSLAAGLFFMLALGPMAIDRATSRRQAFAAASVVVGLILAVARPAGMVLGGITGCFAALLACYAATAAALGRRIPLRAEGRPAARRTAGLLLLGLPLFATSFIWAFYMTANRWVVSFLAPPLDLGHFAFGANITYLIVGAVAALSQFYYPAIVGRAAAGGSFSMSRVVARDLSLGVAVIAVPAALGIVIGPLLIDVFYKAFSGSDGPVRILLAAVPTLVLSSWLMPLSLSTAARPWIEGVVIYPLALILLVAGTWSGYRLGGIDGAAWGMVASAPVLMALQLGNLRLARLLSSRDALRLLAVTALATVLLAALSLWMVPHGAVA